MSKYESRDGWKLLDIAGQEIGVGDSRPTFRDDIVTILGTYPPHKSSSQGKIYVQFDAEPGWKKTLYVGVIDARWVHESEEE